VKKPRALLALPLIALLALVGTACVGTENPEGWAAPVYDGSSVYFLSSHDRLAAAPANGDASTTITWSFPDKNRSEDKDVKLQAVYGEPVVDGDKLYFSSFSGGVFSLDKATGRPTWRMKSEIHGNVAGGVAVGDKFLAFGTTEGDLYVVNKADKSAAPNWPAEGKKVDGGIWATPIIRGDTMYVATMDGDLEAFRLSDGSEIWAQPFHSSGAIPDITMLNDNTLFAASLNKHAYFINPVDGTEKGEFEASDWVWTQAAFDPKTNTAYFGDFSGVVYAVDITQPPGTFKESWHVDVGDARVKAAPAIVDNVLVVADRKPVVHFLNLQENGKELNKVPLTDAGTVRADVVAFQGNAYVGTTNGKYFRADPKNFSVNEVNVVGRQ
jgi:outer membrane protein assembly factor BamB